MSIRCLLLGSCPTIFSHATALLTLSSFLTGLLTPATVFISSYSLLQIYEQRYQKSGALPPLGLPALSY